MRALVHPQWPQRLVALQRGLLGAEGRKGLEGSEADIRVGGGGDVRDVRDVRDVWDVSVGVGASSSR